VTQQGLHYKHAPNELLDTQDGRLSAWLPQPARLLSLDHRRPSSTLLTGK
jgi:hypothetical protein